MTQVQCTATTYITNNSILHYVQLESDREVFELKETPFSTELTYLSAGNGYGYL